MLVQLVLSGWRPIASYTFRRILGATLCTPDTTALRNKEEALAMHIIRYEISSILINGGIRPRRNEYIRLHLRARVSKPWNEEFLWIVRERKRIQVITFNFNYLVKEIHPYECDVRLRILSLPDHVIVLVWKELVIH